MAGFDREDPEVKSGNDASPADSLDATGLFEKRSPEKTDSASSSAERPASAFPQPAPPEVRPADEAGIFTTPTVRPVVHEVKFQAPGTGDPKLADPLQRILHSSAVGGQPGASVAGHTQLFSAPNRELVAEPAGAPPPDQQSSGANTAMFSVAAPVTPAGIDSERVHDERLSASAASSSSTSEAPGFTQLFQALQTGTSPKGDGPAQAREPEFPSGVARSGSEAKPDESESGPPSFTHLFSALDTTPGGQPGQPGPDQSPAAAQSSAEGSFTQMFSALRNAETRPKPPEVASAEKPAERPNSEPGSSEPGSFTRMFSALEAKQMLEAPRSGMQARPSTPEVQASFTQMFSKAERSAAEQPTQADQFPPLGPGAVTLSQPAPHPEQGFPAATSASMPSRPGDDPFSTRENGGLTRMLRALDNPAAPSGSTQPVPFGSPGGAFSEIGNSDRGALQQEFAGQSRPDATVAFRLPEAVRPVSSGPPLQQGPGEYTRILQASALRESARSSTPASPLPPPAPPATPAAASAPLPVAPLPPWFTPHAPQMPNLNTAGGVVSPAPIPPAPHMPAFQMPTPPAAIAIPAAKKPSLLPIILIAVIVVLVGLIVALLLMRH